MAKRERPFSFAERSPEAPPHRVLRGSDESLVFKRDTLTRFSAGDIRSTVLALIGCCTPGVWLRILPLDKDNDSLYFHTGQEWADVQPCLQECGLVTTPGRLGGKLSAPLTTWKEFAGASAGLFEVSTARPIKGTTTQTTSSVFVMRRPKTREERKFASPIDQLKAGVEVQPVTPIPSEHKLYFRHCRIHLLSKPMEVAIAAIGQKSAPGLVAGIAPTAANVAPIGATVAPIYRDVAPIAAPPVIGRPSKERRMADEAQINDLKSVWGAAVEKALLLDLTIQPRLSRDGTGRIVELHDRVLADTNHRLIALHVAKAWGGSDRRFDYVTRQKIAEAACRQVSYDFGFKEPFSYSRLPDWEKGLEEYIRTGETEKVCGKPRTGRASYVDRIEAAHPGYLNELFRYARKTLGDRATFSDLADCMNQRSAMPTEERETLSLHPELLRRWSHSHKGKRSAASKTPTNRGSKSAA